MNNFPVDIASLTPQERQALRTALEAEETAAKQKKEEERRNYKDSVVKSVSEGVKELTNLSSQLSIAKAFIYSNFAAIIQTKLDLYGCKSGQNSHTFSDDMGNTITVGFRIIDSFDDTLDMGIAKVTEYIDSLVIDDKSKKLVDMINKLLKKDSKGNLKPSRILDLQNLADKEQDPLLIEGVTIIRESYKPKRSVIFIEAETLDTTGKKQSVPLSITSADFPDGYEPNLDIFK